jgi:hypothetical protein
MVRDTNDGVNARFACLVQRLVLFVQVAACGTFGLLGGVLLVSQELLQTIMDDVSCCGKAIKKELGISGIRNPLLAYAGLSANCSWHM